MPDCNSSHNRLLGGGRITELDALRGLAAVAVVLFHFTTRFEQFFGHATSLPAQATWGPYGVDLFFMLSGFVILMTLHRQSDPVRFAWGRFTRLYPTYWVAVALTFVVVSICGLPGQEVSLFSAVVNLTMVQSLLGHPHVDGCYWSLQAELLFYVNMLVLFQLGVFRKPRLAALVWVLIAVGVQAMQSVSEGFSPLLSDGLSKFATLGSLRFIPLFAIGLVIYTVRAEGRIGAWDILLALLCLSVVAVRESVNNAVVVGVLAMVVALAAHQRLPWLRASWLVYLGALSYPLYLVHQNVGYVVLLRLEQFVTPVVAVATTCGIALALAMLLHHGVEKPALSFLRAKKLGIGNSRSLAWQTRSEHA